MNPGFFDTSHLAPFNYYGHRRPSSDRASSASYTDGTTPMRRELSNSSYVTDSSQTSNCIPSNIGDSTVPPQQGLPSYLPDNPDAFFCWNNGGQLQAEVENAFGGDDHTLLPSATTPQFTLSAYGENLHIDTGVDDPDAVLERLFRRLRDDYNARAQTDRLTYVQGLERLVQTYLGVDSIDMLLPPRELPGTPQLPPQPAPDVPSPQQKKEYICLLCVPPHHRFGTQGTFKRHVGEMHRAKSLFHCMHCDRSFCRKDKLRDHLRLSHFEHGHHTTQEIKAREEFLPVPPTCDICTSYQTTDHSPPFDSWEEWFQCIKQHCLIPVDDEEQPESELHPPNQNDGNAGGAGGGYSPASPFPLGFNAGGASFGQVNDWAYGAGFSPQWSFNTQTRPGCQASCNSPDGQLWELDAATSPTSSQNDCGWELFHLGDSKDASVSLLKQLAKKSKPETHSKINSSATTDSDLSMLSVQMSLLFLDSKPKAVARLHCAQRPLSTRKDSEVTEKMILQKSSFITNVIQGLRLATLVCVVNEISVHAYDKLYNKKRLDDYTKVAVVDPLAAGEKTLHHIHHDRPISQEVVSRQLTRCHASLNAIQSELSTSTLSSLSKRQMCRRKRLSSLFARLRAVTYILSLQKEVVAKETPIVQSSIIDSQPNLVKSGTQATPPSASAIRSLSDHAQKAPSEPCETATESGSLTLRMPTLENSFGTSEVSNFLHALTSKISTPKASFVESYEDLYGLLHHSVPNIPGASF